MLLVEINLSAIDNEKTNEKFRYVGPLPKMLPNSDSAKTMADGASKASQVTAATTATTALF